MSPVSLDCHFLIAPSVFSNVYFRTTVGSSQRIGICCFSDKQVALRSKSKDWLARNQDNVSEWSDMHMSTHGLLFHNKNPTKRGGLVQSGHNHHLVCKGQYSSTLFHHPIYCISIILNMGYGLMLWYLMSLS